MKLKKYLLYFTSGAGNFPFKRYLIYSLPLLFLLLFLLKVPGFIPSFVLNKKVFISYNKKTDQDLLYDYLNKYSSIHILTGSGVHSLEKSDYPGKEEFISYLGRIKTDDTTVLSQYVDQIASSIHTLSKAVIILSFFPHSLDIEALDSIQTRYGIPVELVLEPEQYDPLFMGSSYIYTPGEESLGFGQIFSKRIQNYDSIRVYINDKLHQRLTPEELFEGTSYKTTIRNTGDTLVRFELDKGGEVTEKLLRIRLSSYENPSILLISGRSSISVLEERYKLKKVPLKEALKENLYDFPLLIFDGIPIASFGTELSSILSNIYQKKSASMLFISDSPQFGKRGDNPNIEEILPVELSPRSLKYLPSLNILILLDISASMMGDKLSLAKVSTLELVKNLKNSDRITLLTFWDEYRYLYEFQEKEDINTEIELSPLIAGGGTDLYKALDSGLVSLLNSTAASMQKHIIILSDGNTKEKDFNTLIENAVIEEISISTLAVGEDINSELLKRLAKKTGGNYYRVLSLDEIPALLFEDRKDISRSSFAEDRFTVFDFADEEVSEISGMNLYTPKEGRFVLYRNQFEDPLLLMDKRERQIVLMFLSDIYGYYTGAFFSNSSVWKTFKTTFDSILVKNQIRMRIGEADGTISFTFTGNRLNSPRLAVYSGNRLVTEFDLKEGSFNSFSTVMKLPENGEYTAVLYNMGTVFSRFPFYVNGIEEGRDTGSHFGLNRYKSLSFKTLNTPALYLYLFFLCSVFVTFLSRKKR